MSRRGVLLYLSFVFSVLIIVGVFDIQKYRIYYEIAIYFSIVFLFIIPVYIELIEHGVFYKKGTVDKYFAKVIYKLKSDYKFKIDKNTVDGSRYLLGTYKDYFISIYLSKEKSIFKVEYKIVSFGFYKNYEELNKKVFVRRVFYEPGKEYNDNYIIHTLFDDIEHFQDNM